MSGILIQHLLGLVVGLIYIVVAFIIKFTGTNWLTKLLPPVGNRANDHDNWLGVNPVSIGNIGLDGNGFD